MTNPKLTELLELANLYPSPHNGQPIRLKPLGTDCFELLFERTRGLQAADISYIFSFVTMGVFIEHLELAAQAMGHKLTYHLALPTEAELHGDGLARFGEIEMAWSTQTPNQRLGETLRQRQTSRKKYTAPPDDEAAKSIESIASDAGMELRELNPEQSHQAIWLNQRAVFDDMFDEPVRQELNHWLRYNQAQKQRLRDGLSYDCMELNGGLLKFVVKHPAILRAPVIDRLIKNYYLRTMKDQSRVFYMLAPFATPQNSFDVGLVIMKIWQTLAERGYYLHPFGTIMSNHAAHQDFLKLAGVADESRDKRYLVFIIRCGRSPVPVRSLRLPVGGHLLIGAEHD